MSDDKLQNGMVDVSAKPDTRRSARAQAVIRLGAAAFAKFKSEGSPKGSVLDTARVAGVMAAKTVPQIIPFCHPLSINKVKIDFEIEESATMIRVLAEVDYTGKTGVEMEALTAASAAALTIYDMMKYADHGMVIEEVCLLSKRGGQRGDYDRLKA